MYNIYLTDVVSIEITRSLSSIVEFNVRNHIRTSAKHLSDLYWNHHHGGF